MSVIETFETGQPVSAATFNKRVEQANQKFTQITDNLKLTQNRSALIQLDGVLDAAVSVGDLVYFNTANGKFCPAIARLTSTPGIQGQSVQSQSSRIQGLVLSTSPVQILRNGYYSSTAIKNTLGVDSESEPELGIYYLSSATSGKATRDPGWNMRQPCISYYGGNAFSLVTNYLAHDSHHHSTYACEMPEGGIISVPASAYLGQMSQAVTAIFINGLLSSSKFIFGKYTPESGQTIDCSGASDAKAGASVVIFNNYPFAYGAGIVRAITSDQLEIDNLNGTVDLSLKSLRQQSYKSSAYALNSINYKKGQVIYTPIISELKEGPGITITKSTNTAGSCTVGLSSYMNQPIVASDIVCIGPQWVVTNDNAYIVFPQDIDGKLIATFHIPSNMSLDLRKKIHWSLDSDYKDNSKSLTVSYQNIAIPGSKASILKATITAAAGTTIFKFGIRPGVSNQ